MRHRMTTGVAAAGLLALGAQARAPEEPVSEPPPPASAEPAPAGDPERARAYERLERWERLLEEQLQAVRRGRELLDEGKSPEEVRLAAERGRPAFLDRTAELRRDPGRNRDDAPRQDEPPPTPEELDALRAFAREHLPRLDERLRELEGRNEAAAGAMLRRLAPRLRDIRELMESDPEFAQLRISQMQAAMRMAETGYLLRRRAADGLTPEEIEPLRRELRDLLAAHFDERIRTQQMEIDLLSAQLAELQGSLRDQLDRREEIIDEKVEAIMDRALQGLDDAPDRRRRDRRGEPARQAPPAEEPSPAA